MTINFPGPYTVKIFYDVAGYDHILNLNVAFATPPGVGVAFSSIYPLTDLGTTSAGSLQVWVDALVTDLLPLFSAAESAIRTAELWKNVPDSFAATYVTAYDISEAGTAGGNYEPASQEIYIWRTKEGGTMRLTLMETIDQVGQSEAYNDLSAGRKALVDNNFGSPGVWLGRDTSYPLAFLRMHPGQNEKMFRVRYRGG